MCISFYINFIWHYDCAWVKGTHCQFSRCIDFDTPQKSSKARKSTKYFGKTIMQEQWKSSIFANCSYHMNHVLALIATSISGYISYTISAAIYLYSIVCHFAHNANVLLCIYLNLEPNCTKIHSAIIVLTNAQESAIIFALCILTSVRYNMQLKWYPECNQWICYTTVTHKTYKTYSFRDKFCLL